MNIQLYELTVGLSDISVCLNSLPYTLAVVNLPVSSGWKSRRLPWPAVTAATELIMPIVVWCSTVVSRRIVHNRA